MGLSSHKPFQRGPKVKAFRLNWPLLGAILLSFLLWSGVVSLFL